MSANHDAPPRPAIGCVWIVLHGHGFELAGTSDVPPVPLDRADIQRLRSATAADTAADAIEPDGGLLDAARLRSHPAPASEPLPRPIPGGGAVRETARISIPAPLVLRVQRGEVVARSHATGDLVALAREHLDLLVSVGQGRHHLLARGLPAEALAALAAHGLVLVDGTRGGEPSAEHGAHRAVDASPDPYPDGIPSPAPTTSHDLAERSHRPQAPVAPPARDPSKVPIWPVICADPSIGNALGLGMVVSAVRAHRDGALLRTYSFDPIRMGPEDVLDSVRTADRPGILLMSSYVWSAEANLRLAADVREASPDTVIVMGGPSAPKYPDDASRLLAEHPSIDVIVRGEGEVTACHLLETLEGRRERLGLLVGVEGLTVRLPEGEVARTEDRDRLRDLEQVPSPYLSGLFDHLPADQGIWVLETNRGCPYGCTFCDWGSATRSRIRKRDLDVVRREIDWMSDHGVECVFVADANFGILARDLDITRHLAHLHATTGHPSSVIASYAKNTTKHTVPIIRTLVDSGMCGEVSIAFQTTDEPTLVNVRRTNIHQEAYDSLVAEVATEGLPIMADIMIGLPGSTVASLRRDLQHCIEGDVTARVFTTVMLPNSPMNDPEYREEHAIRVDSIGQIVASRSFDVDDWSEMVRFRDVFRLADHFGILRHVMRAEAARSGADEIDILWAIYQRGLAAPDRYPTLGFLMRSGRRYLTEPMSWAALLDEVRRLLVDDLGHSDDPELDTVLRVTDALLPTPGRRYPHSVELRHDYPRFYREVLRPGPGRQASDLRLADFGPAVLTVTDPDGLAIDGLDVMEGIDHVEEGHRSLRREGPFWDALHWELDSPLRRHLRRYYYRPTPPAEEPVSLTRAAT